MVYSDSSCQGKKFEHQAYNIIGRVYEKNSLVDSNYYTYCLFRANALKLNCEQYFSSVVVVPGRPVHFLFGADFAGFFLEQV